MSVHERSVHLEDEWVPEHLRKLLPEHQAWLHRWAKAQQPIAFAGNTGTKTDATSMAFSSYVRTNPVEYITHLRQTLVSVKRYLNQKH